MKKISIAVLMCFILLISPIHIAKSRKEVYIEVAVYPSIVPAIKVLEYTLRYGWEVEDVYYQFNVTEINMREVEGAGRKALSTDNYDIFVIGASARQYFHGMNNRWRENVRKFVADGGGYVGICGGANEASQGIENPSTLIDRIINAGVLGIANVYVNDDQEEEWQYLYKSAGLEGGVPIACNLTNHPIVRVSPDNPRIIRYEGGPGMYEANHSNPLLGKITPLAIYAEEVSEKAPIHFWKKVNGEWKIEKPVKTDLKGEYAAIATTYGNGRVVLFGPHPEELVMVGGHVEEFLGRNKYTLFRENYLYRWVNGTPANWSYNWWILRRAVAWAAGVDDEHLPPINELMIFLIKPNLWRPAVYLAGREIMPSPCNILIGEMDLEVFSNGQEVVFYVDGEKVYSDDTPPYTCKLLGATGKHEVIVEARSDDAMVYAVMEFYIFNL